MQFAAIVNASATVAAISARLRKVEVLAEALRSAAPSEVALVVAYLIGELPQGKLGLGYATLRDAKTTGSADTATLSLIGRETRG